MVEFPQDAKVEDVLKILVPDACHGQTQEKGGGDVVEELMRQVAEIDDGYHDDEDEDVMLRPEMPQVHFGDLLAECQQDLAMQRQGLHDPNLPLPQGQRYFKVLSENDREENAMRKRKRYRDAASFTSTLMSVRGARAQDKYAKSLHALMDDEPFYNNDVLFNQLGRIDPHTSINAIQASMDECVQAVLCPGDDCDDGDAFSKNDDHIYLRQLDPR